jgi:RES domain-containing protein
VTEPAWLQKHSFAWRLDDARFAATWDSGDGGLHVAGRWTPRGLRAVYCALEPSTALLEVAVHKGFDTIDRVRHVMTWCRLLEANTLFVVRPDDIPNPVWLQNGPPSADQQRFGASLLRDHGAFVVPSVVCRYSWDLVFSVSDFAGKYAVVKQEHFALDTRLTFPASR